MAVDETEVRQIASLAHLALGDAEIREAAVHLDRLLGYVAQIRAVDVGGEPRLPGGSMGEPRHAPGGMNAAPTTPSRDVTVSRPTEDRALAGHGEASRLRDDLVVPGLPRDVVMAQAPAASVGLFEVPRVIAGVPGEAEAAEPAP